MEQAIISYGTYDDEHEHMVFNTKFFMTASVDKFRDNLFAEVLRRGVAITELRKNFVDYIPDGIWTVGCSKMIGALIEDLRTISISDLSVKVDVMTVYDDKLFEIIDSRLSVESVNDRFKHAPILADNLHLGLKRI
jgi:hypothetical protein